MTFQDDPNLVEQDEPMRNSGLSAAIPFALAALALGAVIVFYGANGGQFTANKSAPTMAHSNAPAAGAPPQTTTR
jgi:hypothetical protein